MRRTNCTPVLTTATEKEFAMPDTRTSDARADEQAMTIPERIKAALKAAGRFDVGSTIYLPDHEQTLRVVAVNFTSTKGKQKTFAWLKWESECVECGKRYQFTSKRVFAYPTRTCKDHRRTSRQRIARVAPKAGGAMALRKAVIDVLDGLSFLCDFATQVEIEDVVIAHLPSARRDAIWEVVVDVTLKAEAAGWGVIESDGDIIRFAEP
jgi:hypothetical protein